MLDPVPPCPVPPVPEVTGTCHQLCPERLWRRTALPWPPPSCWMPPSCWCHPASRAHGTSRSHPCCKGSCPSRVPAQGGLPHGQRCSQEVAPLRCPASPPAPPATCPRPSLVLPRGPCLLNLRPPCSLQSSPAEHPWQLPLAGSSPLPCHVLNEDVECRGCRPQLRASFRCSFPGRGVLQAVPQRGTSRGCPRPGQPRCEPPTRGALRPLQPGICGCAAPGPRSSALYGWRSILGNEIFTGQ